MSYRSVKGLIPRRKPEAFRLMMGLRACRLLLFPSDLRRRVKALDFAGAFCRPSDPLFFLTHKHYLSSRLTLAQRIECAVNHFEFEQRHRRADYHELVYRASGLVLWTKLVEGVRYALRLTTERDHLYEGDLSVILTVDDTMIGIMSFSYVDTAVFGLPGGTAMFITRNQTYRNDALNRFRAAFKQNSPPYFCLWALSGIAMANGMRSIYAIKHQAQVSYSERYADGFRNSYDNFWSKFAAEEVDPQAYRLATPFALAPLEGVKHRARAAARRRYWQSIAQDSRHVMLLHSTGQVPVTDAIAGDGALAPVQVPQVLEHPSPERHEHVLQFRKIDTAGRGRITLEQANAYYSMLFAQLDLNSDGYLEAHELEPLPPIMGAKCAQDLLAKLDTNADQRVSPTEFLAISNWLFQCGKNPADRGAHARV
jgi:uncharacterized protein